MMLVEFSVANFRSFAERQTISLVAGAASRRDLRFSAPTGNRAAPEVLRVAAIFGPNNSGKSAFVRALHFFKSFVRESAKESQANDEIEVKPFKFDSILVQQPSEFEVIFITNGNQYQYGFRADARRVHEEWLFHMTRGPGQKHNVGLRDYTIRTAVNTSGI